jgi:NAD(P)-dependent dehydrogenase (short-subunit alcohol dehydrogenase family)
VNSYVPAPRLKNRVAIVTGAGAVGPGWGNGRATAVRFAQEGATVVAVDLNQDVLAPRTTPKLPHLSTRKSPRLGPRAVTV